MIVPTVAIDKTSIPSQGTLPLEFDPRNVAALHVNQVGDDKRRGIGIAVGIDQRPRSLTRLGRRVSEVGVVEPDNDEVARVGIAQGRVQDVCPLYIRYLDLPGAEVAYLTDRALIVRRSLR
jgi:hypothetical protein